MSGPSDATSESLVPSVMIQTSGFSACAFGEAVASGDAEFGPTPTISNAVNSFVESIYQTGVVTAFANPQSIVAIELVMPLIVIQYKSTEIGDVPTSPYFATVFMSPVEAQTLLALRTSNTAECHAVWMVPAGETVLVGTVAPQVDNPGFWAHATGEGEQIYYPNFQEVQLERVA